MLMESAKVGADAAEQRNSRAGDVCPGSEAITALELETKQAALSWLAQITHLGLTRLQMRGADSVIPVPIELSQRERKFCNGPLTESHRTMFR